MAYLVMKVSEILELLRKDGWLLVATRGSHRQFKHPAKPGRVTVAGKPSDDIARNAEQRKTGTDHGLLLKIHLPDQ